MSSRALRRLQQNSLEQSLANLGSNEAENEARDDDQQQRVKAVNIFALMGDDDDEGEASDSVHASSDEEHQELEPAVIDKPVTPKIATKSQKKKNKKKNKQKNKKSENSRSNTPENVDVTSPGDSDEDLDRILEQFRQKDSELERKSGGQKTVHSDDSEDFDTANEDESQYSDDQNVHSSTDLGFLKFTSFAELKRIFGLIDMKKLNPDYEYKLLFDDISSDSLADVDSMTSTHVSPQAMKQIEKLRHMVRNWGGRDRKSVPNGSTTRRLAFTKIRDDWIPTTRGELVLTQLTLPEIKKWQYWQRPQDWAEEIDSSIDKLLKAGLCFYKFEPSNSEATRKAMTEFYMSVVLHPDHEALIALLSSKHPYHVPALLQVALILVREGDKSNSNGLVERALFVFDRALRSHVVFNGTSCQLPYIYFFNRQFYFAIFRYIQVLSQRGAIGTAAEWCKTLWSLSPLEDPLGCRYFIDHYLLMNKDFDFMAKLAKSPLINTYSNWYTLGMALGFVLSYLKLGLEDAARAELRKAYSHHALSLQTIFEKECLGDKSSMGEIKDAWPTPAVTIELKAYLLRMKAVWGETELSFLRDELITISQESESGALPLVPPNTRESHSPFFIESMPVNLLRFAILSQESSLMACVPEELWSERDVYEFDVLPPQAHDRQTEDVIETINSFVSDDDLAMTRLEMVQDEALLNQMTQMSLEQFLEENPNAGADE
ncbi:LAFA_0G18360g1_1 [Lachancea sp. 'fantastica']|nr:LAFA_0G18360g1_1 [Lachancea sp. 'fantastica']